MKRITIWDLDYYYAKNKKNLYNTDAMKISSFHKQLGDTINFVIKEDDIYRPYDIYYIIKENFKTPNPPAAFFFDKSVRWWGKAVKPRINWKMSDIMLGCRPDYLLYPNLDTRIERAERIQLFNNKGEPLKWIQDWGNSFKSKEYLVVDKFMWHSSRKNIIEALKKLKELPKISFSEPIFLQKIIPDEDIKKHFFELNFNANSRFVWRTISLKDADKAFDFLLEFKKKCPTVFVGTLMIDYRDWKKSHWEKKEWAIENFNDLRKVITRAKTEGTYIEIVMPSQRLDTPYYQLFEELASWTKKNFKRSWIEWISFKYGNKKTFDAAKYYWSKPKQWHSVFRVLLLQTREHSEFIRHRWKDDYVSKNDIPWMIWEKEFILKV